MFLVDWLIKKYPTAKRTTLKRMVEQGRVTVNDQPAQKLKQELAESDYVRVADQVRQPGPTLEPLEIIHEDEDVLVVYKPAGLLTSTVANEKRPTAIALVRAYLAHREPKSRAGVIHRLDRDASGLLVFSKNNEAYEELKGQFYRHTVDRIYTAVVQGKPAVKKGRIESRLVELPDGSVRMTRDDTKGQVAITDYEVIGQGSRVALLRVTLHTGRKHQIRTQLSQRGMPILGDSVYGEGAPDSRDYRPKSLPHGRGSEARATPAAKSSILLLCATELAFDHPRTGERVRFEPPPPPEIRSVVESLVHPKTAHERATPKPEREKSKPERPEQGPPDALGGSGPVV